MKKKLFKLATLGCRTNQYETQAYRDQLLGLGFAEAQEGEVADLCIVNTCTVTESADSSSRYQIRQLAKHNPGAEVIVTGCFAQRRPDLVQEIEGVTKVVPNLKKGDLIAEHFPEENVPEFSIRHFEAHTRAFVKVQDGCNSFCTYCIIPYVRGRSRSRPIPEILEEVKNLIASGYKEVVITGINVGDFDGAGEGSLADLIRAVDSVEGLERLRLSSIDPDEVTPELAEVIVKGKNTCPSMHIVLQAGSNVVLKRMNRKYTRQIFLNTVDFLKSQNPDFTFTTDVIVGFPGETEADFNETLAVMEEVKFAKVHMFPYSKRERTRAATYPNQLPVEVIKERKEKLLRLSEQIAFDLRQNYLHRTMTILTEHQEGENTFGHTGNFLGVIIPKQHYAPNQLVEVFLQENTAEGLIGIPTT